MMIEPKPGRIKGKKYPKSYVNTVHVRITCGIDPAGDEAAMSWTGEIQWRSQMIRKVYVNSVELLGLVSQVSDYVKEIMSKPQNHHIQKVDVVFHMPSNPKKEIKTTINREDLDRDEILYAKDEDMNSYD